MLNLQQWLWECHYQQCEMAVRDIMKKGVLRGVQRDQASFSAQLRAAEKDGGLVVSYRRPSGRAGRRMAGWSAQLQLAWQSPH